jgi:hypothetical protein
VGGEDCHPEGALARAVVCGAAEPSPRDGGRLEVAEKLLAAGAAVDVAAGKVHGLLAGKGVAGVAMLKQECFMAGTFLLKF